VKEDEIIIVSVISFFDELGPLLAKTPKRFVSSLKLFCTESFNNFSLQNNRQLRHVENHSFLILLPDRNTQKTSTAIQHSNQRQS